MSEPQTAPPTFPQMLEALHRDKHTGPVTFHFQSGQAITVEIPEEPTRIRLDMGTKEARN